MREKFVINRVFRKINHRDISFLDFDRGILFREFLYRIQAENIVKIIMKISIIKIINSKICINP